MQPAEVAVRPDEHGEHRRAGVDRARRFAPAFVDRVAMEISRTGEIARPIRESGVFWPD